METNIFLRINIFVWLVCFHSGSVVGKQRESLDVLESEEVLLQCRFSPVKADTSVTLYWIRSNREGSDNAAIESTSLDPNYRVERYPSLGQYDLKILNATYDRDNGQFACMVKEAGTGKTLHTKAVGLTVLLPPSPPTIHPPSPVAIEGKPLNLTCSSSGGSPPPQIRWYREGSDQVLESRLVLGATRDQASTSSLTISPHKNTDGAVFRCTVWNRALGQHQNMETRTRLSVNYFPRVTIGQHNPLRLEEGDTAVLTCQVDSKPAVDNVKWTRGGRYIATTFRHVIPTLEPGDQGSYFCEADNNLGQAGKAELQLAVLFGPRVSFKEKFREVAEGGDLTVECEAEASPAPASVTWSRADTPTFRQSGRWLQLRNVTARDGGEYTCTVTNRLDPSGEAVRERSGNATMRLAVRHAPGPAHVRPAQPVGIEGKSVTLVCGAAPRGYPAPSFTWWRADKPAEVLGTEAELTVRPVRMSSAGRYLCQPHNNYGKGAVASVQLQVVQEPRIVTGLSNQVVRKAGDTGLNLTCLGRGKPSPSATWFKDGAEIDEAEADFFSIQTSESGGAAATATVTSTLLFRGPGRDQRSAVRAWDSGEYTCQFDNAVGRAQSAMALKVEHAPVVAGEHRAKVAAEPGERADIVCRMRAFPAPEFRWEKDEVKISDSSSRRSGRAIRQIGDTEYEATFTLWRVAADSYGEYVCVASNSMGATSTIVTLVRKGKPERPSELRAAETAANSVLVAWTENFNGGMNNTSFQLQWAEQGAGRGAWQEKWCPALPRPATSCQLDGLAQHTTYLARVRAVNTHGESAWSEQLSVTTQIDVAQIPTPEAIFFEKSSRSTSFKVATYPLPLAARLEVLAEDGGWQHLRTVSLRARPYKFSVNPPTHFQNVRVRICLESDDMLCGAYNEASVVDKIQEPQIFSSGEQSWLLAVIIVALVCSLVTAILVLRCCCRHPGLKRQQHERKYVSKEAELQRPDILHPSLSFDQKLVTASDTGHLVTSPSHTTDLGTQLAQYCQHSDHSGDSGNRASVNSQDSLWHVKEEAATQQSYAHFADTDYAHYPRPEEYLVSGETGGAKLWQYTLGNGDQYAVPSKVRPPHHAGDTGEPATGGPLSVAPPGHKFHLMFDGNPGTGAAAEHVESPSHVSTPRKVIREIIV